MIKPWEISATTRNDTIALVEEEVQYLLDTIRKLRTHHNALLPFSRLPRELMTKIFWQLMPNSFIEGKGWLETPKRWIAFSETCSFWRSVAL